MAELQEAVETYTYVISGLSGETQMSYCDKLEVFVEFCAGRDIHTQEDLTPKVFTQFIQHVSTRIKRQTGLPIRNHTIAGYGRIVKIFLSWAATYEDYMGCIKSSVLHSIAVPKLEQKVKPVLTIEEIQRLYAACHKEYLERLVVRDQAILSLLLDCGLRPSELCGLPDEQCPPRPA